MMGLFLRHPTPETLDWDVLNPLRRLAQRFFYPKVNSLMLMAVFIQRAVGTFVLKPGAGLKSSLSTEQKSLLFKNNVKGDKIVADSVQAKV